MMKAYGVGKVGVSCGGVGETSSTIRPDDESPCAGQGRSQQHRDVKLPWKCSFTQN